MPEVQEYIYHITYLFNQGMTRIELAFLAVIDNVHISVHHLKRQVARLQL